MKITLNTWQRYTMLLAVGALNALAFAAQPLPAWILPFVQLICLTILAYWVFQAPSRRQSTLAGLVFGFGHFALGMYWIFISLHRYGGLAWPPAVGAVILLAVALALFFAAAAWLSRFVLDQQLMGPMQYGGHFFVAAVWASSWTLAEWLRGTVFTGLPWLNSGYAHVDGLLAGWAPIFGVYGVAWLAAFIAGAVALLARAQNTHDDKPAATIVVLAIALALAGLGLRQITWSEPTGAPLIVRLVQGNVPQSEKFDPELMQRGLDIYMKLASLPPKEEGADPAIVALPETIMTLFQNRYPPEVWEQWKSIAQQQNATLIMGVPLHTRSPRQSVSPDTYTNSAIAFTGDTPLASLMAGTPAMRYDKHHLVPFGEFVPKGFRWFVDALHIPLGDFNRGELRQDLFELNGQVFAPNICYEDVFGEEIIASVRPSATHGAGATILINISNLGWFGNSLALGQHLQISRMRAVETARPMLRATNTGMTAAIDPDGQVRAVLPAHVIGVLDVEVQGTTGLTPYVRWSNYPVLGWSLLWLLAALMLRRRS